MQDKVVIITGATAGIGLETARQLAAKGAVVVGIGRNAEKCNRVSGMIRAETGNFSINFLVADLSSQDQVRLVAKEILERYGNLDVLINNVGAMFFRRKLSVDGIEMTWALNHLSYFQLTNLLLPRLKENPYARIINVSSSAHYNGKIFFEDPQLKKRYWGSKAYSQSKLANIMFTYELARRLKGTGVTANAVHPGLVRTDMSKNNGLLFRLAAPFWQFMAIPVEEGARTPVFLAAASEVYEKTGKFYIKETEVQSSPLSYEEDTAKKLWALSEKMIGA